MSKIKMQNILEVTPVITKIINEETIAGSAKLKSAELVEPFNKRMEAFNKERQSIVIKLGEKVADKDEYKINQENQEEFNKLIQEMLDLEHDLPDVKFNKDELKLDISKITGLDLAALKKVHLFE